jgi:hypothetical protein
MKSTSKYIVQKLLVNDITYKIFQPFLFVAERLKASRANYLNAASHAALQSKAEKIFADKVVCNGPFRGMKFDRKAEISGSTYAMLLGSFESEIQPFILRAGKKKYNVIYNIGCADGYYAVGFAHLMPGTVIYAYDSDKAAISRAQQLAARNFSRHNIRFLGTFYPGYIRDVDPEKKSLFIVDCEGAERSIFTKENSASLVNADLIIEMHINIYPDLEEYFTGIFGATHHITVVDSLDDHLKAKFYSFLQIDGLDYALRRFITEERAIFMQWIILCSKNTA